MSSTQVKNPTGFAEWMRAVGWERGLRSNGAIAAASKLSIQTVSSISSGYRDRYLNRTLVSLARGLQVSPETVMARAELASSPNWKALAAKDCEAAPSSSLPAESVTADIVHYRRPGKTITITIRDENEQFVVEATKQILDILNGAEAYTALAALGEASINIRSASR